MQIYICSGQKLNILVWFGVICGWVHWVHLDSRQGTPSVHWYMSTFVHGEEEAEIEMEREVSFSHSQPGRGLSWQREDRRSLHILKLLVL